jgi:hypothetical protein
MQSSSTSSLRADFILLKKLYPLELSLRVRLILFRLNGAKIVKALTVKAAKRHPTIVYKVASKIFQTNKKEKSLKCCLLQI